MPVSFNKVHKHISKKRGAVESLHEFSRDARRLRRANHRDDRVARVATATSRGRQSYVDRIAYFQEIVPEDSEPFSDNGIMEAIETYINRSNDEIAQLKQERRKGRPPSKREEALLQRVDLETKEYKTGFWMPDFSQPEVLRALASWNGDWSGLSMMKFIRFTKESGKQASSFPPKGMS